MLSSNDFIISKDSNVNKLRAKCTDRLLMDCSKQASPCFKKKRRFLELASKQGNRVNMEVKVPRYCQIQRREKTRKKDMGFVTLETHLAEY